MEESDAILSEETATSADAHQGDAPGSYPTNHQLSVSESSVRGHVCPTGPGHQPAVFSQSWKGQV